MILAEIIFADFWGSPPLPFSIQRATTGYILDPAKRSEAPDGLYRKNPQNSFLNFPFQGQMAAKNSDGCNRRCLTSSQLNSLGGGLAKWGPGLEPSNRRGYVAQYDGEGKCTLLFTRQEETIRRHCLIRSSKHKDNTYFTT